MDDDSPPEGERAHLSLVARGKALKQKRVEITDSLERKSYPRYTQLDPILLNPYSLLILVPQRAYLVEGNNLDLLAVRFKDEAITSIQPHKTTTAYNIDNVTMYWLFRKTPEELLEEIMEVKKTKKPILETVN